MAQVVIEIGGIQGPGGLGRRFADMITACGPDRAAANLRRFLERETGVLKRKLSQLIAKEGPLGVFKWYRTRIIKSVQGAGLNLVGVVEHDGVEYASTIEHGRRPGKTPPPAVELLPWIRKFMRPTDENDEPLDEEEIFGFAIALSQRIGERGVWQPGQTSMLTASTRGPGRQHYARIMFENRDQITQRAFDFYEESIMRCIRGGRGSRR